MGTYTDFRNYFKDLAVKNKMIKHLETADVKKFYEFSLEELVLGSVHDLPGFDHGPFMIYTGFIESLFFTAEIKKRRELMFFIQQGCDLKSWEEQSIANDNTMICVEQILSKIINDSRNDYETVLEQSFNQATEVRIIPNVISVGGKKYFGWQVSLVFVLEFTKCFSENDWIQEEEEEEIIPPTPEEDNEE